MPALNFQFFPSCSGDRSANCRGRARAVLSILSQLQPLGVRSDGDGCLPSRPFNSFPVAAPERLLHDARRAAEIFQFFPSCSVYKIYHLNAVPIALSILSQLQPAAWETVSWLGSSGTLSILSQLQHDNVYGSLAHRSPQGFQFFPSCSAPNTSCIAQLAISEIFQFFPSCS